MDAVCINRPILFFFLKKNYPAISFLAFLFVSFNLFMLSLGFVTSLCRGHFNGILNQKVSIFFALAALAGFHVSVQK